MRASLRGRALTDPDANRTAILDVNAATIPLLAVSAAKGAPRVRVYDATGPVLDFLAYDAGFQGGVRVAVGDVTGDAQADVVTAPGPGAAPQVKLFNGRTGRLESVYVAAPSTYRGGVQVAVGDVSGDGRAEVITAIGAAGSRGAVAQVKVFDGANGSVLASYLPFGTAFLGGVHVAAGDINGDGREDVVAGAATTSHVKIFSGVDNSVLADFLTAGTSFTGGVTAGTLAPEG